MLSLALASPLLAALTVAASAPDETEDALDALIEQTNALDGFTATYSIESSDGETGTLRLAFESAERGRFDLEGGGMAGSFTNWLVDGEQCFLITDDEEGTTYARCETHVPVFELVQERFPIGQDDDLGPGLMFALVVGYDAETDKVDFELTLALSSSSRPALLGWLLDWRGRTERLELTEDEIVLTHERYGGTVARATGFPTELWMIGKDGVERRFRLETLELEAPTEDGVFELPDPPADAKDDSESARNQYRGRAGMPGARQGCLSQIDTCLTEGQRQWNEDSRVDAREVFAALHTDWVAEMGSDYMAGFETWVESYVDWLEAQADLGGTQEELRATVEGRREELEVRNEESSAEWWNAIEKDQPDEDRSGHLADLIAIEEEVFRELHAELFGDPLLAAFDEAVASIPDDQPARMLPPLPPPPAQETPCSPSRS